MKVAFSNPTWIYGTVRKWRHISAAEAGTAGKKEKKKKDAATRGSRGRGNGGDAAVRGRL